MRRILALLLATVATVVVAAGSASAFFGDDPNGWDGSVGMTNPSGTPISSVASNVRLDTVIGSFTSTAAAPAGYRGDDPDASIYAGYVALYSPQTTIPDDWSGMPLGLTQVQADPTEPYVVPLKNEFRTLEQIAAVLPAPVHPGHYELRLVPTNDDLASSPTYFSTEIVLDLTTHTASVPVPPRIVDLGGVQLTVASVSGCSATGTVDVAYDLRYTTTTAADPTYSIGDGTPTVPGVSYVGARSAALLPFIPVGYETLPPDFSFAEQDPQGTANREVVYTLRVPGNGATEVTHSLLLRGLGGDVAIGGAVSVPAVALPSCSPGAALPEAPATGLLALAGAAVVAAGVAAARRRSPRQ